MDVRRKVASIAVAALASAGLSVSAVVDAPAAHALTFSGSAGGWTLNKPVVDMAVTPSGNGYWLVATDGGIFGFGDAKYYGSTGAWRLNKPIVGMTAAPDSKGYWLVASDGGIFGFGTSGKFYGSAGAWRLNAPIVGMARTHDGKGYWLVASDGGIFGFGNARYLGGTGGRSISSPIVAITVTPTGNGYWLTGRDGTVYNFGDAQNLGSLSSGPTADPVVSMTSTASGHGLFGVTDTGEVLTKGDAHYYGSAAGTTAGQHVVGIAANAANNGYWVSTQWGAITTATGSGVQVDPNLVGGHSPTAVRNDLINRINRDRLARGLHVVFADGMLQAWAGGWANVLGSTRSFSHQNLGSVINSGPWNWVGENLFAGPTGSTAGGAHVTLMHSDHHRPNILFPEERYVGVGIACMYGRMVVVEDFASPMSIALQPHGEPPLNPITSDTNGASC